MTRIYSLRPNVTGAEAALLLHGRGLPGALGRLTRGPLRRIAPWYVPFRVYAVNIRNGRQEDVHYFAADAVNGALDLYRFNALPERDELVAVETRNCMPAALDPATTRRDVTDKVRRAIYQTGFFRLRSFGIDARPAPLPDLCVPYWVGFYGAGDRARVAVVDAVRRRPEGARVRELIRSWLAVDPTPQAR
jgi:hypothetical protein